jgi:hypothetical protein
VAGTMNCSGDSVSRGIVGATGQDLADFCVGGADIPCRREWASGGRMEASTQSRGMRRKSSDGIQERLPGRHGRLRPET